MPGCAGSGVLRCCAGSVGALGAAVLLCPRSSASSSRARSRIPARVFLWPRLDEPLLESLPRRREGAQLQLALLGALLETEQVFAQAIPIQFDDAQALALGLRLPAQSLVLARQLAVALDQTVVAQRDLIALEGELGRGPLRLAGEPEQVLAGSPPVLELPLQPHADQALTRHLVGEARELGAGRPQADLRLATQLALRLHTLQSRGSSSQAQQLDLALAQLRPELANLVPRTRELLLQLRARLLQLLRERVVGQGDKRVGRQGGQLAAADESDEVAGLLGLGEVLVERESGPRPADRAAGTRHRTRASDSGRA